MKTRGSLLLGLACMALLLAPPAQAHKLTEKKAKAALSPLAAETAPLVQAEVAAQLPGITIAKTRVEACVITKKGHRADCTLVFSMAGGPTKDTDCLRTGRVEFRSKRSKRLKVSLPFPGGDCIFHF